MDHLLERHGLEHPEIRWMVQFQFCLALAGTALCGLGGFFEALPAFAVGAGLATFNFFVLARMVPKLVQMRKGGTFSLLCSFYLRLVLTAVVLVLGIVVADFSVVVLLAGLSTVLLTFVVWGGRYILTNKHKEA